MRIGFARGIAASNGFARQAKAGEAVKSCTIIVSAANAMTQRIHDHMPVAPGADDLETWLSGAPAAELLAPAPEDMLQMWPVSRRVNRVGNDDDPKLIEAIP